MLPMLLMLFFGRMQQFVGQLNRQPFQNLFGRRAFGKLAHRAVKHLPARTFALVAQCANQRNPLAALLPCNKLADFLLHHRFGTGSGRHTRIPALRHTLCHIVHRVKQHTRPPHSDSIVPPPQ